MEHLCRMNNYKSLMDKLLESNIHFFTETYVLDKNGLEYHDRLPRSSNNSQSFRYVQEIIRFYKYLSVNGEMHVIKCSHIIDHTFHKMRPPAKNQKISDLCKKINKDFLQKENELKIEETT